VRKVVVPGVSREAIVQRFGEPTIVDRNPKFKDGSPAVDEIIYYFHPSAPRGVREDFAFAGFQVRLKAGKVVQWFPTHRSN
jgi:hypothetical protein